MTDSRPSIFRPRRRTEGISFESVGLEALVYNEQTHHAYCLNALVSVVWSSSDGTRTVAELAGLASVQLGSFVSVAAVEVALEELSERGLLVKAIACPTPATMSRRKILTQMGVAAAIGFPAIAMVVAPRAAQAYSGCFDCDAQPSATRTLKHVE